jgi:transcription initiation factor IIE alpha subunit
MDKNTLQRIKDGLARVDAREGLDVNELLNLPDDVRQLLTWMVRSKRFMSDDLVEHLGVSSADGRELLALLLRNGFIEISEAEEPKEYRTRVTGTFKHKFKVQSDIWKLLDD